MKTPTRRQIQEALGSESFRIRTHPVQVLGRSGQRLRVAHPKTLYYLCDNPDPVKAVKDVGLDELITFAEALGDPRRNPITILAEELRLTRRALAALDLWPMELVVHFQRVIAKSLAPQIVSGQIDRERWERGENHRFILAEVTKGQVGSSTSPKPPSFRELLALHPRIRPLEPIPPDRALLPEEVVDAHPPESGFISLRRILARLADSVPPHPSEIEGVLAQDRQEDQRQLLRWVIRHRYASVGYLRHRDYGLVLSHYYTLAQAEAIEANEAVYRDLLAGVISERLARTLVGVTDHRLWWMLGRLQRNRPEEYQRLTVFFDGTFIGFRHSELGLFTRELIEESQGIQTLNEAMRAAGYRSDPTFKRAMDALFRHGEETLGDQIFVASPTNIYVGTPVVRLLHALCPLVKRSKELGAAEVNEAYRRLDHHKDLLSRATLASWLPFL